MINIEFLQYMNNQLTDKWTEFCISKLVFEKKNKLKKNDKNNQRNTITIFY